jgi:lipid-binding SYLF domain-containing protein
MTTLIRLGASLCTIFFLLLPQLAAGASAEELEINVDAALANFQASVSGGEEFLKAAKGVLVFPTVIKAGFFVGAEYGEGAMRIDGKTAQYYSTAGLSFGFQIGAQAKTQVILFMQEGALEKFQAARGWEAGVDGSVAIAQFGAGGSIDTTNLKSPIIAFIFNNRGLMANLTLEGSKFSKISR